MVIVVQEIKAMKFSETRGMVPISDKAAIYNKIAETKSSRDHD